MRADRSARRFRLGLLLYALLLILIAGAALMLLQRYLGVYEATRPQVALEEYRAALLSPASTEGCRAALADLDPRLRAPEDSLALVREHILQFVFKLYSRALLAAVARDVAPAVVEAYYREVAVRGAALAQCLCGVVSEIVKLFEIEHRRSAVRFSGLLHSEQRTAESAHQPCDGGADNVPAKLHLEGAKHCVV